MLPGLGVVPRLPSDATAAARMPESRRDIARPNPEAFAEFLEALKLIEKNCGRTSEEVQVGESDAKNDSGGSRGRKIRGWISLGLSAIGATLGLMGFVNAERASAANRRLEVQTLLNEAWDLMGGEAGGAVIRTVSLVKDRHVLEQARRKIDGALILAPQHSDAHRHKGTFLVARGQLDQAEDEFEKALKHDRDNDLALNGLGAIAQRRRRLDEAIEHYRNAVAINPERIIGYLNLGGALFAKEDYEAAAKEFREAIDIDPGSVHAHRDLATALYMLGDIEAAIDSTRRAVREDPTDALAHRNLADLLSETGKLEEALEEYQRAIDNDPHDAEARQSYAKALAKSGNLAKADLARQRAAEVLAQNRGL